MTGLLRTRLALWVADEKNWCSSTLISKARSSKQ